MRLLVVLVMLLCGSVQFVGADIWACKNADGSETYSDSSTGAQCRKLQNLPQLIPAPAMPSQDKPHDAEGRASSRSQPPPNAGGGRQLDPPADDAIYIRDIKAVPNYNSTLGTANYQADMRLMNGDPDWTAAQVCIDVHFRDRAKIFIDVHQKGCLEGLKPLDDRTLTVIYKGTIPPRLSPIEAEARVSSVKWVK
jgi:hypothetical protein